jgi:glyceraldehyde-3-phosphate dehydrogenase (NAD(P))
MTSPHITKKIVHVVGTGTIGEPLIGILASFRERFGIKEVIFHKRSPLLTDRSKVVALGQKGFSIPVLMTRGGNF